MNRKQEKLRIINKRFNLRTLFSSGLTLRSLLTRVKPTNMEQETKNVAHNILRDRV